MISSSLYHGLAVDELPLSLKMEGSDLKVRMGFRHSGIFNKNDLFAHKKDFFSSDDIGNGAILVLVSALHSYGIKYLFLYLIRIVVIEMVTVFPMANQFS